MIRECDYDDYFDNNDYSDNDGYSEEERKEYEENFDARMEARIEKLEAMWEARQEQGEVKQRIKDDHPNLELERRNK